MMLKYLPICVMVTIAVTICSIKCEHPLIPEIQKFIPSDGNYTEDDIKCLNTYFGYYLQYEKEEKLFWFCDNCDVKWKKCCLNYTIVDRLKPLQFNVEECKTVSNDSSQNWSDENRRFSVIDGAIDALLAQMKTDCEPEIKHNSITCDQKKKELRGDETITQNELCATDPTVRYTKFRVNAAFKVGDYIGLVGRMWRAADPESGGRNASIRVMHTTKLDTTNSTQFNYYDARVWNEFQTIDEKMRVRYAFSTRHMASLFANQKTNELVFSIQGSNKTTAYQFNYKKLIDMEEPTIDWDTDVMTVYDEKQWGQVDRSGYLHFKLLLVHFPSPIKVTNIMIFDRTKRFVKDPVHYAIVYTEEIFEGKPYYFRQYMRTSIRQYVDYRTEEVMFSRLDWQFDQSVDYCTELKRLPSAVVFLYKEETVEMEYSTSEGYRKERNLVHFIEFYGLKHKLMRIRFDPTGKTDKYVVEEDNGGEDIDNAESLIHCVRHPSVVAHKRTDCQKDYNDNDGVDVHLFESNEWRDSGSNQLLFWFIFIALIICFLLVIGFAVFVCMAPVDKLEDQ